MRPVSVSMSVCGWRRHSEWVSAGPLGKCRDARSPWPTLGLPGPHWFPAISCSSWRHSETTCPVRVLVRTPGNIVQPGELGAGLAQCHVQPLPLTLTGVCQFLKARPQLAGGVPMVRVRGWGVEGRWAQGLGPVSGLRGFGRVVSISKSSLQPSSSSTGLAPDEGSKHFWC